MFRVPESINFPKEEENVLKYWKEIDAFKNCLKQSKNKPRFSFYDGPPFATGLPHYGHILAGTIKDVVTRFAHQSGYHVERRFGWDCHGLPVEYEIDKTFGIKGPEDVTKMGIKEYNAECRKIVTRYTKGWETMMERIGRWIDFENDYKTMYPWFMESVWWVFKELYNKGLVYKGNKVMPYSTACNTPLSNFESGQNYKDVIDPAITVSLSLIDYDDKEEVGLLIWTTTPWTLPSNLACCVNPRLEYCKLRELKSGKLYIMLKDRIETIFPQEEYEIVETYLGSRLKGLRYKPVFTYFEELYSSKGAFRVLTDDYVTKESGTGIVHQAPYFGEDDYRVCLENGVILKDDEPLCPIDASGRFSEKVHDFKGEYVKDADKKIIAALKNNGKLVHQTQIKHSYPYCWRSDTPLIYRSVPSWFIRVEHMRNLLQENVKETHWVPEFVKEKRFSNWLAEARDWAVSRNRYWGTPIPIWMSDKEIICIGSIAELEDLTKTKINDIHRETIDNLEIPSKIPGNPPLKRIPEIFDCWFESGSMPYAQQHFPFEKPEEFSKVFPANFIAEGIDQTRGWFYTLVVISTALFGEAPFKNLIANGLVLASDGQKMSKRKKNYVDPAEVVEKYGADALRLYLISSPVVKAENLRFKEEGVRDVVKDVLLPWYNAFRFLMQNIDIYNSRNDKKFCYYDGVSSNNIMDMWIVSFTQSLFVYVHNEMEKFRLYNVVPRLVRYIHFLTNWYIRMNRNRLRGGEGLEDCFESLTTLFGVLFGIVKIMAPFAPFISEYFYQTLKKLTNDSEESVHYLMFLPPNRNLINTVIERCVLRMQNVIELGRVLRDKKSLPTKYPLPEIVVVHQDQQYLEDILSLKNYILLELNVKSLKTSTDKNQYGISLRAEPDYKQLGNKLKNDLKEVAAKVKNLLDVEIEELQKNGKIEILGHVIELNEIKLVFQCEKIGNNILSDNDVLVLLDANLDTVMLEEGLAREIVNRVQKLRKKAKLVPTDEIDVYYKASDELMRVCNDYKGFIEDAIKVSFNPIEDMSPENLVLIKEQQFFKEWELDLVISKTCDIIPCVRWVNLLLLELKPRFTNSTKGLALLEVLGQPIKLIQFKKCVFCLFGVKNFDLWSLEKKIETDDDLLELNSETIFVTPVDKKPNFPKSSNKPFCAIYNFSINEVKGCLVLENPQGQIVLENKDYQSVINMWINVKT